MKIYLTPSDSLNDLPRRIEELRQDHPYPEHLTFILRDGEYSLKEPILLDQSSMGSVTIKAENEGKAVVSGGKRLAGWNETVVCGMRVWELHLPEVELGKLYFRQLFVDGNTRPRARFPKFDAVKKNYKTDRIEEIRTFGKSILELGLHSGDHTFKVDASKYSEKASWRQAEAVILHFWVEERMPELSYNAKTGWLESSYRSSFNLREAFNEKLARFYIDNLDTALTEKGEWFLDQYSGVLKYLPHDGENLATAEVIAPVVCQWIQVHGEPHKGNYIEHVKLEGLVFKHADWCRVLTQKDRNDQPEIQDKPIPGASQNTGHLPGCLSFMGSRNCEVRNCEITQTGFFAIAVERGCSDIKISRCHLHHLGGGGIKITGFDAYDAEWTLTKNVSIEDCEIHHGGIVYHAAPGIVIRHAFGNRIVHNHISHFFNSGIACGCVWSYETTRSHDNVIEGNHIHTIGQGLSNDMGGVYILGVQQGTFVRKNWIHNISAEEYGAHGIYLDESCSHVVVEENLVHEVDGVCFLLHRGRENIVRNNIFAFGKHAIIENSKSDGFNGFTFIRNIVVAKNGSPVILGGYSCDILKANLCFESNLYWSGSSDALAIGNVRFNEKPHYSNAGFEGWKAVGQDQLSIEADPLLKLTESGFQLKPESPALKLGFKVWDAAKAGPRPDDFIESQEAVADIEMKFG